MLLLALRGDVNHGVKGTEVTLRDGKYEGVVYAFDGLGVGGADADHRFVAFGVAAWVGRVILIRQDDACGTGYQ